MKVRAAIAFAPHEPLQMRVVDLADPGPGEVMVRLHATGLCHSDLHVLDGKSPQGFPVILGHEGVGDVVCVGEGVIDFAAGDRVMPYLVPDCGQCVFCRSGRTNLCVEFMARRTSGRTPFSLDGQPIAAFMGLGTFAELTVVPADMLTRIDRSARADHACCIGCGVTTGLGAALIAAEVRPGSSVAIFGAGGVGLSVVQGARIAGAAQIIAIDVNESRRDIAMDLGATSFINANDVENVTGAIMAVVPGGVDFAFECVGVPALARQALECTNPAWGLAMCVGAMPLGSELAAMPLSLMTGRRWTGSLMGGAKRQDAARFVDMYVAGEVRLDAFVSHHLAHDDINHGFAMMRSGEAVRSVVLFGAADPLT